MDTSDVRKDFRLYMREHCNVVRLYIEWDWQELVDECQIIPYGIPVEDKPRGFADINSGGI